MSKRTIYSLICVSAFVFLTLSCAAQTSPEQLAAWKTYKVGTAVQIETRGYGDPEDIDERTVTLVEKNVLEIVDGKRFPQPWDKPRVRRIALDKPAAATTQPASTQPDRVVDEGFEDITVAGQKVHAHRTKVTKSNDTVITTWTSDEVPGGVARSEYKRTPDSRPLVSEVTRMKKP